MQQVECRIWVVYIAYLSVFEVNHVIINSFSLHISNAYTGMQCERVPNNPDLISPSLALWAGRAASRVKGATYIRRPRWSCPKPRIAVPVTSRAHAQQFRGSMSRLTRRVGRMLRLRILDELRRTCLLIWIRRRVVRDLVIVLLVKVVWCMICLRSVEYLRLVEFYTWCSPCNIEFGN